MEQMASHMAAIGSIDPLDTALVETEHSILAALPLKIGKQIVPGPEEFATVVAKDPVVRTGVGRILSLIVKQ